MAGGAEAVQYGLARIRSPWGCSGRRRSSILRTVVFREVVQQRAGLLVVEVGAVAFHPVDNSLPLGTTNLFGGYEICTVTAGAKAIDHALSRGLCRVVLGTTGCRRTGWCSLPFGTEALREIINDCCGLGGAQIQSVAFHPIDNSGPFILWRLLWGNQIESVTAGTRTLDNRFPLTLRQRRILACGDSGRSGEQSYKKPSHEVSPLPINATIQRIGQFGRGNNGTSILDRRSRAGLCA